MAYFLFIKPFWVRKTLVFRSANTSASNQFMNCCEVEKIVQDAYPHTTINYYDADVVYGTLFYE